MSPRLSPEERAEWTANIERFAKGLVCNVEGCGADGASLRADLACSEEPGKQGETNG